MFELIGMREIRTPNSYKGVLETSKDEDVVATFDTMEMAQAYMNASRLKEIKRDSCWDSGRGFKKKSLLRHYTWAEIRGCEEVPHNPVV